MKWSASAPANIALIKYMGKKDYEKNLPSNASLSYTLDHLQSFVELETSTEAQDIWQPLPNHENLNLNAKEQKRFLSHLNFIKRYFDYNGAFYLRSANNFPASCGLASSASSFAALTQCATEAICALQNKALPSLQQISALSRQGSGSSCRSFFKSFALWESEQAHTVTLPYSHLLHMTILITREQKKVSSSDAHHAVTTSLLFADRPQRAQMRLDNLIAALQKKDWEQAYQITWQEFWDMHALFETANPTFGYFLPNSFAVLNYLRTFWQLHHDGPLITMDAGPNIHLLFRPEQQTMYQQIAENLGKKFQLFTPHLNAND